MELRRQGIGDEDGNGRERVMAAMLQLPMHGVGCAWVVVHQPGDFEQVKARYLAEIDDFYDIIPEDQFWADQAEKNFQYAHTFRGMLDSSRRDWRNFHHEHASHLDRLNLCFGTTPLHIAVRTGSLAEVLALLAQIQTHSRTTTLEGQPDDAQTAWLYEVLAAASRRTEGADSIICMMIDHFGKEYNDPVMRLTRLHRPLLKEAISNKNPKIFNHLFPTTISLAKPLERPHLYLLFLYMIKSSWIPCLDRLCDEFDLNSSWLWSDFKLSIFQMMIWNFREYASVGRRMIKFLLEKGGDPNDGVFLSGNEWTPLQIVAYSTRIDAPQVLEALLDYGADVNAGTLAEPESHGSAVHIAASRGALENVRVLLKRGVDPCGTYGGKSLLENAHEGGISEEVERLVDERGGLWG